MSKLDEAIAGLRDAVQTPLTRNDLGRLAQMHSWAQVLADEQTTTGTPEADPALHRLGAGLVRLLERIILDEAADPVAGITRLPEIVGLLETLAQGRPADVEPLLSAIEAAIQGGAAAQPAAMTTQPAVQPAVRSADPSAPTVPNPPAPASNAEPAPGAARGAAASPPKPISEPMIAAAPSTAPPEVEPYVSEPLVLNMNEREHLEGFLAEAAEHMDTIEVALLDVEANPTDLGKLNELFRPFHTIKGIAGFLDLRDINRLTHEIETILDLGRKGERRITPAIVDLIFAGVDALKAQLAAIRQYLAAPTGGPCPQPDITAIMAKLRRAAAGHTESAAQPARPRLGEVLVAEGVAASSDVEAALEAQQRIPAPRPKLGEILVEEGIASEASVRRAVAKQQEGTQAPLDTSIRVDTAKLDMLVDAVGELVIAQAMVGLHPKIHEDDTLLRSVSQVNKIVRDVQETAMAMRMVPIGQTFQKMRRVVRDVARKAGKLVDLVLSGEDTELDKNVIQQISDPLVHLVRNAIDHGIETPDVRRQLGKPETGQVHLHAAHEGDSIVIEIRDDGRGLDRDRILAKGLEKGLIRPDEALTDQQLFALILQPGFSTAEKVTDISGRGVGMDVVRRNVEQLRGKIEIQSAKGAGTTITIRLPLTLAIIDGMLVRVGRERMIIPTILIERSLRPTAQQIVSVQGRGQMLQVRGELCPLVQLAALLDYGPPVDPCENLVVIVQTEGRKVALVVSELIGQQQVVIKSLSGQLKGLQGISGAAILGDGRVGLILEPGGVLALHNRRECPIYRPPATDEARATGTQVTDESPVLVATGA